MTAFKSDFLNILQERGFIHQCSDVEGLDALAAKGEATAYVGYDCTAPSLHIGNFLTMMMLYWLQQSGNKPITLMGGGTTMVGDPSGKDESRALRTVEEIEANKPSIGGVFSKVLHYGNGPADAVMLDNAEWLTKLNWIEMLRDIGRHFSVNRMLTMDSVRLRLEREQEMSFIEFNYMVCQAYDFVELSRRVDCRPQIGGSDQWGHIVNGVDLARRTFEEGALAETLPTVEIPRGEFDAGLGVLSAFVKAELLASNGEARRQIKGGGLRVNDVAVTDEKMVLTNANLTPEGVVKLSLGKKRHVLLKPV